MKPLFNRTPLAPSAMAALPIGEIIPRGWLHHQLYLQAISITGHLDEIWDDLGPENGWLGGTGESWERGPYYCDGLVPLAYLLNDTALIAKARRWVEWSIASQLPNGSFGPQLNDDPWPRTVMLKALIQYHSATGDTRIPQLINRYFEYLHDWLQTHDMVIKANNQWASYRAGDLIYALVWLYNLDGQEWLLEVGMSITEKSIDWTTLFNEFPYKEKARQWEYPNHVVNNAMGIKEPVFRYLLTKDEAHKTAAKTGILNLMKYHGLANGIFSGDENLAGPNPTQGTETCAVVEYLFSLELLAIILGDAWYGDLMETVAFNTLPGCFTPDMWGHCYDQQPNGVLISQGKRNWSTNGDDANLMGLEPNYGCCTANLHHGWPKFAASLWGKLPDGGLAAIAYAPCDVLHKTRDGMPIKLSIDTEYPFRERVQIKVTLEQSALFTLALRIPGWCQRPVITLNAKPLDNVPAGDYVQINRTWSSGDTIELYFPMDIQVHRGYHDSMSIQRGPLVYSLKIGESWQKLKGSEPCPDWEVYPTTPWNYAMKLNNENPPGTFTVIEKPITFQPFDSLNSPIELLTQGYLLPDWKLEQNSAGDIPVHPTNVNLIPQTITLIPYGAAKLRITSFPVIP